MDKQIEPTILAYLAGIIDGEGCVGIYGNHGRWLMSSGRPHIRYRLDVKVGMSEPEPILLLTQIFGGSIYTRQPQPERGRLRSHYTWTVSQRKAKACLIQLTPYLRAKRAQAELALEFTYLRAEIGHRRRGRSFSVEQRVMLDQKVDRLQAMKREARPLLN